MTGPTLQNAFLAGVHNSQAQPAATQTSARAIATIAAVMPSARNRKDEAPTRRAESMAESGKAHDRGIQARDPRRARAAFESELSARVDPAERREGRRRRGRRHWRQRDEALELE
jgi:hypothetical protein